MNSNRLLDRLYICVGYADIYTEKLNNSTVDLIVATQEATMATTNFVETLNSIRNRYTAFGWFLYRIGVI